MVSNACDATDEKRRSGVRPYMPTLETATRINGDKVEIIVRDNGLGIPDEIAEKIFNPFFTTKPTDKGTGLGLALSNDIVREHGGLIRVASQPGGVYRDDRGAPALAGPDRGVRGLNSHSGSGICRRDPNDGSVGLRLSNPLATGGLLDTSPGIEGPSASRAVQLVDWRRHAVH